MAAKSLMKRERAIDYNKEVGPGIGCTGSASNSSLFFIVTGNQTMTEARVRAW